MMRRSPSCRLAGLLFICFALLASAQTHSVEPESKVIRIGFTNSIFKNQNETDVLASLKVWAMTLAQERGLKIDPTMPVFRSRADLEKAVREGEVDAITLLTHEYAELPTGLVDGPFMSHVINGDTRTEFVLIARKNGGPTSLRDLRGTSLIIQDEENTGLAGVWLDAELLASGLGLATVLCTSVEYNAKLSAAVLGVFFGKHDAALVSRGGFLNMAELNPQIARDLHVLKASPRLVHTIFCFRKALDPAQKQLFLKEIRSLHESVVGRQVLNVFKSSRVSEVTADQLNNSLALLQLWQAAIAEAEQMALQAHSREP